MYTLSIFVHTTYFKGNMNCSISEESLSHQHMLRKSDATIFMRNFNSYKVKWNIHSILHILKKTNSCSILQLLFTISLPKNGMLSFIPPQHFLCIKQIEDKSTHNTYTLIWYTEGNLLHCYMYIRFCPQIWEWSWFPISGVDIDKVDIIN